MTVFAVFNPTTFNEATKAWEHNFDFKRVEDDWGKVQFILPKNYYHPRVPQDALADIKSALTNYDPEVDYLLLTGYSNLIFMTGAVLASLGIRKIRVLIWSNRDRLYSPIWIEI